MADKKNLQLGSTVDVLLADANANFNTLFDAIDSLDETVGGTLAATDVLMFKGTLGEGGTVTALPAEHSVGHTYKVATPGTYAGKKCEIGDMIICITAGTVANDADWAVVQNNVDLATTEVSGLMSAADKTVFDAMKVWYEGQTYVNPKLSSVKATPDNGGVYEKGVTKTVTNIMATVTPGTSNVVKVEALNGTTSVTSAKTGTALTGALDFAGLTIPVTTNTTFTVKATCADGKTVTGNTGSFTFVYPYYWGVVAADATVDEAAVKALTKKIETKNTKKPSFTANNQKMVFASPYAVSKITDPNGFDVTSTFTKSDVSITGLDGTAQTYYVYTANDAATVSAFVMTFTH